MEFTLYRSSHMFFMPLPKFCQSSAIQRNQRNVFHGPLTDISVIEIEENYSHMLSTLTESEHTLLESFLMRHSLKIHAKLLFCRHNKTLWIILKLMKWTLLRHRLKKTSCKSFHSNRIPIVSLIVQFKESLEQKIDSPLEHYDHIVCAKSLIRIIPIDFCNYADFLLLNSTTLTTV